MSIALDPQHSITVVASAGSGKTHTLVSRIVRLLLAGANPRGILALTFTRKAAAEMRSRVEERLQALAYDDDAELDQQLAQLGLTATITLRQQARALYEAVLFAEQPLRAMTLHAFCQDLLARFPLEAGVPAGFTLIEGESELRRLALAAVFDGIRREPNGNASLALDLLLATGSSERAVIAAITDLAAQRADLWALTQGHAEPLRMAIDAAWTALDSSADADCLAALRSAGVKADLAALQDSFARYATPKLLKSEAVFNALAKPVEELAKALLWLLMDSKGEPRKLAFVQAVQKRIAVSELDALNAVADRLRIIAMQVSDLERRQLSGQRTAAALTLATKFLQAWQAELAARNGLAFAELEWRSYLLLTEENGADWVRYKLDQKLEHLLLDEFQDTSATQWQLLLPLLRGLADSKSERLRSAFVVGDAKQSIYSFRRAQPELLDTAAHWLNENLTATRAPLNESWRSAPVVIDFVNRVFAGTAGQQIAFTTHATRRQALWGRVEILPLVRIAKALSVAPTATDELRNPLTTPRADTEQARAYLEGQQLATRLLRLHAEQLSVAINHGAASRAMQWGDVIILARHRTHLHHIEHALAEAGIPFVGASRGTLLATPLIRDLRALLRALDAEHRDLELAHALRSPVFDANDADLILLASQARLLPGRQWHEALTQLVDLGAASPALQRAQQLLSSWRQQVRRLPVHDLLDRIVCEGDIARRFEAALPGDARVRANLASFVQLALEADQGRTPGLARFLDWIDELTDAGKDAPDEAPPPASNQVRVMTIHAAKGLEAPLVWLVNTAPAPQNRSKAWLLDWPLGEQRPRALLLSAAKDARDSVTAAWQQAQQEREQREALNLLYVAVTRAQQYLFASGFESGAPRWKWEDSWHAQLWQALSVDEPAASNSQALAQPLLADSDSARVLQGGSISVRHAVATPDYVAMPIDARLRRPLPAATDARLRASEEQNSSPSFSSAATRRGTLIHALLEYLSASPSLSLSDLKRRVQQRLNLRLDDVSFEALLSEARAVISAPDLAAFFAFDRFKKAWNEVAVQVVTDSGLRSGVIDRLVDDGNTLWVLDYKSHREGDASSVLDAAREQLQHYRLAVCALWPARTVQAGVIWTPFARWLPLS